MKKKLLPLMIAGLAVTAATTATAEVKVYGKANVSVQHNESEKTTGMVTTDHTDTTLNSNASRIGFKGSEKLTDDLSAVYKMEYETSIDDGEKKGQTFAQRNIYVGLKGSFGMIAAGKNDTPLKKSQGKIDQFNDLKLGDIKNVIEGEKRESNSVWYSTPAMGGLNVTVAAILEDRVNNNGNNSDKTGISAAVSYKADGMYFAIARDQELNGMDITRLSGQFAPGDFGVGLIYQMAEQSEGNAEQTGLILSAFFKAGKNKFKAQYGMSEDEAGSTTTEETTSLTLGVDHKLSKRTKVYTYYSMLEKDKSKSEKSTLGVGLEVKF